MRIQGTQQYRNGLVTSTETISMERHRTLKTHLSPSLSRLPHPTSLSPFPPLSLSLSLSLSLPSPPSPLSLPSSLTSPLPGTTAPVPCAQPCVARKYSQLISRDVVSPNATQQGHHSRSLPVIWVWSQIHVGVA